MVGDRTIFYHRHVWILAGIAVVAVVLIFTVGQRPESEDLTKVDAVEDGGLVIDGNIVDWSSIFEISVITRTQFGGTWFGFELRSETAGLLLVGREADLAERFLANSHRFPGFDHGAVATTLERRRGRTVCYHS